MTTEMSAASELIHEKFQSRKATSEVRPAIPFMAEQVLAKERADENPMELSQIALMFAMFGFTSKIAYMLYVSTGLSLMGMAYKKRDAGVMAIVQSLLTLSFALTGLGMMWKVKYEGLLTATAAAADGH